MEERAIIGLPRVWTYKTIMVMTAVVAPASEWLLRMSKMCECSLVLAL